MAKTGLDKLFKLRKIRERETAMALATATQARQASQEQQQHIEDMAQAYKQEHLARRTLDVGTLQQFRLFYAQLAKARQIQASEVERANIAERTVMGHLQTHINDRRGLQKVLEQREIMHKTAEKKRDQRRYLPTKSTQLV